MRVLAMAALVILSGCATTQVHEAGRDLASGIAGSLFLLALHGPEAVEENNRQEESIRQMERNKTLTAEQRHVKRERRQASLAEIEAWELYDDATSFERKYDVVIDENVLPPLQPPVGAPQNTGPTLPFTSPPK